MNRTLAVLATAAAITVLAACGTTTAPTQHVEGDTAPPSIDPRQLTELAVDLTWDSTSETDRDSMCTSLALYGTTWAAQQLQPADDNTLDWDYAAQLIQHNCDQR